METSLADKEYYISNAIQYIGLTRPQAIAYMMERKYNAATHEQAMAAIIRKSWLWSQGRK